MRKERTLFFIGIWIGILSFLGFPNSWRKFLFAISGLAIIYLAYLFREENKTRLNLLNKENQTMDSFVDNIDNL